MLNEKITGKQASSIMMLFLLGSSLVTGASLNTEQDSWLALLVALLLSVPVLLLFAKLNGLMPGKSIYDMAYLNFGGFGGGVVTVLISLYAFHLGLLVIKNFTEYVQILSLPNTPQPVNAVCMGLIAFFSVRKGFGTLARAVEFVMPLAMLAVAILLVFAAKYTHLQNLQPLLAHSPATILKDAVNGLAFPFAETVLFISVFSSVGGRKKFGGLYLTAMSVAGGVLMLLLLECIMIMGFPFAKTLYFPSYEGVGAIDIGHFLSRIEVLVSGNFIVFCCAKVSVCLYTACLGFKKLFRKFNFQIICAVTTILMAIGSQIIYENTAQMFALLPYYTIYAPFFEILIPLVLMISILVQRKRRDDKSDEYEDNNVGNA